MRLSFYLDNFLAAVLIDMRVSSIKMLRAGTQHTGDSQHPVHFLRKPSTQVLLNRMGLQHFDQNEKSDDFYAL